MPVGEITLEPAANANISVIQAAPTTWSAVPEGVSTAVPPLLTASQAYYWTHVWQQGEREALDELRQGKGRVFADSDAAIRWLLSADDD
jgi:hypothetical protein